jgi:hypothetical protein
VRKCYSKFDVAVIELVRCKCRSKHTVDRLIRG